jgi:hypothetical protein
MKGSSCGHWNKLSVNKIFVGQPSPIDSNKVKVMVLMYEPLETVKCKKCGKAITEPKELIRIVKGNSPLNRFNQIVKILV